MASWSLNGKEAELIGFHNGQVPKGGVHYFGAIQTLTHILRKRRFLFRTK